MASSIMEKILCSEKEFRSFLKPIFNFNKMRWIREKKMIVFEKEKVNLLASLKNIILNMQTRSEEARIGLQEDRRLELKLAIKEREIDLLKKDEDRVSLREVLNCFHSSLSVLLRTSFINDVLGKSKPLKDGRKNLCLEIRDFILNSLESQFEKPKEGDDYED